MGRRKPKINAERKQVVFEVASSPPLSHTRAQLPKEDGIPDLLCKSNGLRSNSANPLTNVPGGSAPQPEAQTQRLQSPWSVPAGLGLTVIPAVQILPSFIMELNDSLEKMRAGNSNGG